MSQFGATVFIIGESDSPSKGTNILTRMVSAGVGKEIQQIPFVGFTPFAVSTGDIKA